MIKACVKYWNLHVEYCNDAAFLTIYVEVFILSGGTIKKTYYNEDNSIWADG